MMKHGLNHYIVLKSNSGVENSMFKFLLCISSLQYMVKEKISGLANLSRPLKEGYSLKVTIAA